MSASTRDIILEQAEVLIRTRGYAAFSFADLAQHAQITKASVHYHFPSKEALIVVLYEEYLVRFVTVLGDIRQNNTAILERLRAYAHLFLDGFEKGMLPLCGALSAERSALPDIMQPRVQHFFELHIDWLKSVLEDGVSEGAVRPGTAIEPMAMLLLSTLEGGSFVGWALGQKAPVLAAFDAALSAIGL